jgi:hypothetical protein
MADEEPKIKNPGRVAWGKKLAKMSKELKEKKKNAEMELIQKDIVIDQKVESKLNLHHIEVMIGIGGLLVAAIALYVQCKKSEAKPNFDHPYLNTL